MEKLFLINKFFPNSSSKPFSALDKVGCVT